MHTGYHKRVVIIMGQREVIDYLKRNPDDWVTRDEIIRNTACSLSAINITLKTLVQAGEIERRYERVDNPDEPGKKRVLTWIKLTVPYKYQL